MRPIRKGDRGPAVEDVQRRLRALGADLVVEGGEGDADFGRVSVFGEFCGALPYPVG